MAASSGLSAPSRVSSGEAFLSQHNIIGSEAFSRSPFVIIRQYRAGGLRRRRLRTTVAFVAGAAAMLLAGLVGAAAVYGPALAG